MRRVLILSLTLMLVTAAATLAAEITVDYNLASPILDKVWIEGIEYDRVSIPGLTGGGDAGEPSLPAGGAQILLPPGEAVVSVEVRSIKSTVLGRDFLILPASKQVRLSADPSEFVPPTPDAQIYAQDTPFPGDLFEEVGIQTFRGYRLLVLKLQPVQYTPATGELVFCSSFTVAVTTESGSEISPMLRGLAEDDYEIRNRVDNPSLADSYAAVTKAGEKNYELLIICPPSLTGVFQILKDYHDSTGTPTEIHTTDESGTLPKDVRAFISDQYSAEGISYVLLGGDDDVIPAPDLYVTTADYGGEEEWEMPGDLYFGCLDNDYDGDGDGIWGEPNDGPSGTDVDLVHEVYIGRAPVGSATEASRFVCKTIGYLTSGDAYLQNFQLVGEYLGFGGVSDYAAATLDQLVDSSDGDGYSTIGLPSDQFEIGRLYDRDWPGHDWPRSALTALINNGLHVIDHLGHGSPDYAMKYTSSQLLNEMTNSDHFFLYSQTCLAGHFDDFDCWAECATIMSDHAAFAVVMNARYGYGAYNSTDGVSQRFNREFWDAIYNPAEARPQLGRANADAKEDNLYRINDGCMRWVYYESNLFGDPTIELHGGGVWFTMDEPYGPLPHTVTFNGSSSHEADAWIWDFGDGETSDVQNPTHTYGQRGSFDVLLTVVSDGEEYSRLNCACVGVIADSVMADSTEAVAGETVEVTINATTAVPVSQMIVPVQFSGAVALDRYDITWSTEGCRSSGLDVQSRIHFNPASYQMTFRLANTGSSQDMPAGTGPILKLFFQLDGTPEEGQETVIDISGYDSYEPSVTSPVVVDYSPAISNGLVYGPKCCQGMRGNVDNGPLQTIDVADLVYLVTFMFQEGAEPQCWDEANIDGDASGMINIEDLVILVMYMFQNGPEPAFCD